MSKRCRLRDYVCRPSKDAQHEADIAVGDHLVWRLDHNGRWAPDNGKSGLAFVAGCIYYYPDVGCDCYGNDTCVRRRSSSKCFEQVSCANGRGMKARKIRR